MSGNRIIPGAKPGTTNNPAIIINVNNPVIIINNPATNTHRHQPAATKLPAF
ncbi:hypothetical protein SLEP1_g14035 [Rubroshorea leprosula]|uniref:Uncharacterized protein n=1 Tax=Rubroshorea leprosula TaxID=152421 RepID=A0AAV5IRK8_9ROSI|nr:hypothetical protein SLEP1_g14035 [Rubroshorea leprosula]